MFDDLLISNREALNIWPTCSLPLTPAPYTRTYLCVCLVFQSRLPFCLLPCAGRQRRSDAHQQQLGLSHSRWVLIRRRPDGVVCRRPERLPIRGGSKRGFRRFPLVTPQLTFAREIGLVQGRNQKLSIRNLLTLIKRLLFGTSTLIQRPFFQFFFSPKHIARVKVFDFGDGSLLALPSGYVPCVVGLGLPAVAR